MKKSFASLILVSIFFAGCSLFAERDSAGRVIHTTACSPQSDCLKTIHKVCGNADVVFVKKDLNSIEAYEKVELQYVCRP